MGSLPLLSGTGKSMSPWFGLHLGHQLSNIFSKNGQYTPTV
jgi:hypothetical protein